MKRLIKIGIIGIIIGALLAVGSIIILPLTGSDFTTVKISVVWGINIILAGFMLIPVGY